MLVKPECIPCYFTQALSALKHGGCDEDRQSAILMELAGFIPSLKEGVTPAYNSSLLLHKVSELMKTDDPFRQAKTDSNKAARRALESMGDPLADEPDPLLTALKLAVAGNIIDLGIQVDYDIAGGIKEAMRNSLDQQAYSDFKQALARAKTILVVGDNSGEIVFDRVLVGELLRMDKEVVYSVKGGPILNDATMQDAKETGMTELVKVIDTGNNLLGVDWGHSSPEFRHILETSDLVIAKGQANYESLEGTIPAGDKTFFLLKAKCPVVADHLGASFGDWILRRNVLDMSGE
ncbi:MAG: damage-control phosphatase ARMT1 family protein [Acidobacteriota bacterium]